MRILRGKTLTTRSRSWRDPGIALEGLAAAFQLPSIAPVRASSLGHPAGNARGAPEDPSRTAMLEAGDPLIAFDAASECIPGRAQIVPILHQAATSAPS